MNPIFVNCLILYITVLLISLVQSRFKPYTDSPITYIAFVLIAPLIVYAKAVAKGIETWTGLTALEILFYTVVIAFLNVKSILPKINEGYVYAYTLLHWYLLIDTVYYNNWNIWLSLVAIISVYPTIITIRALLTHKILSRRDKIIMLYWFLFTVAFTYVDQVALHIINPVVELYEISALNFIVVFVSAIQLYFVSIIFALIIIAIPIFHLDNNPASFRVRWKKAKKEHREILNHKIDSYIDYQISYVEVALITIISGVLFYFDMVSDFRGYLIIVYTVIFPLVFFYFKWSPDKNIEVE